MKAHDLSGVVKKGRQGLASMSAEEVSRVTSLGGKAAHAQGVAHEWTAETARLASAKGVASRKAKGA